VVTDPGAFFQSDSHVRLPFGGPDALVSQVATRIVEASQKFYAEWTEVKGSNTRSTIAP
jgi:hypothetical protein